MSGHGLLLWSASASPSSMSHLLASSMSLSQRIRATGGMLKRKDCAYTTCCAASSACIVSNSSSHTQKLLCPASCGPAAQDISVWFCRSPILLRERKQAGLTESWMSTPRGFASERSSSWYSTCGQSGGHSAFHLAVGTRRECGEAARGEGARTHVRPEKLAVSSAAAIGLP